MNAEFVVPVKSIISFACATVIAALLSGHTVTSIESDTEGFAVDVAVIVAVPAFTP